MKCPSPSALALLPLLLAACASDAPLSSRVSSAPLSGAPKEVMAPVKNARAEVKVAREALKNARSQADNAAKAAALAERELGVVTAKLDQARVQVVTLQRLATEPEPSATTATTQVDLGAAQSSYEDLLSTAEIARLGLALAKRELVVAQLRQALHEEELHLAEARLDLVTGRAIDGLDLPATSAVPLADLRNQEGFCAREVAHANARLSAARVAVQRARDDYDAAIEAARVAGNGAG